MKLLSTIVVCSLLFTTNLIQAQTIPVGLLENVEDAYRRQQLLGNDKSKSSYMIRPLSFSDQSDLSFGSSDQVYSITNFRRLLYSNKKAKAEVFLLPVVLEQQYNSHHPYGINDGSMVQAKGYQTQVSAGVYAKVGPLSIQLRPEYVYADNKTFQKLSDAPNGPFFNASVAEFYNSIDLPDRYGDSDYSKLRWGQSSIRLNAGPVSVGLSTENLWWGPGIKSSLLMSNNAAGFAHFSFNTIRPIETYIGAFEAQIIAGRLNQSGIDVPVGTDFQAKPKDWRYISAFVITYQPKWIPNFFLGLDRSFVVDRRNMGNSLGDYFPIFGAVEKKAYVAGDGTNTDDEAERDQYISFFTRYVFPESKAEIYLQFGRTDHAYDLRDAIVEPEHTRAYIFGFRKLIPLNRSDEYIQMGVEFTQMEKSKTRNLRASGSWYNHYQVLDGYTNEGQVIGAGIGPGSNLQSLDVSWVKGLKKIGLQFERLVNNNDLFYDFAYASLEKSQFINRHWVDLSVAGKFAWNFKQFVLNSQLTYIRSLNYQYQWKAGTGDYWNWDKQDVNNLQVKVGILYNW
jgi:hypothetical protein